MPQVQSGNSEQLPISVACWSSFAVRARPAYDSRAKLVAGYVPLGSLVGVPEGIGRRSLKVRDIRPGENRLVGWEWRSQAQGPEGTRAHLAEASCMLMTSQLDGSWECAGTR